MTDKLEEQILSRLRKSLANLLEISEEKITKNSILEDDFGMDSFDKYQFGFEVEEEFDIKILDGDMQKFKTLKNYVDYILKATNY